MPLISADELETMLGSPELRVVDVRWTLGQPGRGRGDYGSGHIPGAIFLDVDTDLAGASGPGRHPLPDPGAFARRLAAKGIGDDHLVVAYDDQGGITASRLWWMLDDLGHTRVRVLDGGYPAWVAAGGPVSTDEPASPAATLHVADHWTRVIDRSELSNRLDDVVLLDLRSGDRYRGEVEPIDPVAGHIPGAISLPWQSQLDAEGRFQDKATLRGRLEAFGGMERPVVVSCGSGITACQAALALREVGLPDPILYEGSYSDWSRSGMPVATGPEPGALVRD